ncbi:MAG: RNA polymerase sigma factor [Planctomycetes bacterium]|nr:RNA polymerase sigma factor [Planctomycetota bacterium]
MNQQDQQDIEDARNGDHDAFRRLVERHEANISRLMWRFTQSEQVCEELVQEAFVEAYFSLGSYRFKAPFLFWLKTIATRVGYRLWKRQAKERKFVQIDYVDDLEAPEQGHNDEDLSRIANMLLEQLAPADRMVLTLLYFEKCSVREIAEHMGWNQALVKTRAYRARKKLLGIANRMQIWDELEWIV